MADELKTIKLEQEVQKLQIENYTLKNELNYFINHVKKDIEAKIEINNKEMQQRERDLLAATKTKDNAKIIAANTQLVICKITDDNLQDDLKYVKKSAAQYIVYESIEDELPF